MSNFSEQELHKLFADSGIIENPKFVGRACLGTLGKDLCVRAEFVTLRTAYHYEALQLTVLNRTEGVIDKCVVRFKDIFDIKQPSGPFSFRDEVCPYIWDDTGKAGWNAYQPTPADFNALRRAANEYLDVFREQVPERTMETPAKKPPGRKTPRKSRDER